MDFFDIMHGLLTERGFTLTNKALRDPPTTKTTRCYYKKGKYSLELWMVPNDNLDDQCGIFYIELTDVGAQPAPLTLDDLMMVIERGNQITPALLADPSFDPNAWLDDYLKKAGLNG